MTAELLLPEEARICVGEKMEKLKGGIWIGGFLGLQGPESNVMMR